MEKDIAKIIILSWVKETLYTANTIQRNIEEDVKNMWIQFIKKPVQACTECRDPLDPQSIFIHYKQHLDYIEEGIDHYFTKGNVE